MGSRYVFFIFVFIFGMLAMLCRFMAEIVVLGNLKKKTLRLLFMDGVQLPQGYSHFEEAVYFLPFPEIPGTHFIDLGRMKG